MLIDCAKMTEPIDLQFRLWTLHGSAAHIQSYFQWRNLPNTIEPSV